MRFHVTREALNTTNIAFGGTIERRPRIHGKVQPYANVMAAVGVAPSAMEATDAGKYKFLPT